MTSLHRRLYTDGMTTPRQLLKEISEGKFKAAYYFYGSEDYRISEAVKYIAHQFLPDKQISVNYRKFDGRKTKAPDLITELSTLPMLGEKQLFVVTDMQSYKPTEISKIISIIPPVDPHRVVIFTSPSLRTPRKGAAFFKTIGAVAEIVEFKKMTPGEVAAVIQAKLSKAQLSIEPNALKLFTELIAGNRGALETESQKLINYKNSGETVTAEDIHTLCSGYEVFQVFELADHVVKGDAPTLMKMLWSILSEGGSPVQLTSLMQQHFSTLYLVKHGKKPIGNRGFLLYKLKPQADKYTDLMLEQIIIDIAEADGQLRKSGMSPEMVLETLALSLVRAR